MNYDSCCKQIVELQKKIQDLENKISKYDSVVELQTLLRIERFKSNLYLNIIKQNTNIRIEDILIDDDNIIPIKKIECKTVHKQEEIKKPSYKPIKVGIELVPEIDEEDMCIHIDLLDAEVEDKIAEFGNIEEAYQSFDKLLNSLKQSRIYSKILSELNKKRWSIFGSVLLSEYTDLLQNHVDKIEQILKDRKYPGKKCANVIGKSLSPLESRLIRYGNYTTSNLEIDELERLNIVLDLGVQHSKEYCPFDMQILCDNFYNYGSVVFSISKNIERYLFNRYGFNSVIYLPLPKNMEKDPFSYYTLDNVCKGKRHWKMDCRLEELSNNMILNILPYLLSTFRKLYKDVFGDNEYRPNYTSNCQLMECDCEQLVQNILIMGRPKEFCNIIRKLVKKKASYNPTENDKFNLQGDDALQRKRFQEKEETDIVDIVKRLFDGITSEIAVDFYRSRS